MAGPTGFTPAGPTDFGLVVYHGNRSPDDPTVLLDGVPLIRFTSLKQRALDLHGAIPSFNDVQEVRLAKLSHAKRISDLMRHRSEGGFELDENAPQVVPERKKLERAEQELARLTSLQEIRSGRWNAVSQLERNVSDWLLRGGVPGDCVLEAVEDAPLSELLVKADGNRITAAVERCRFRLRELAADLHRVKSAPWHSSVAKSAARELINRLADQGQPNLDGAIEHGAQICFAQMRLTSLIHNVEARGAVAYAEIPDTIGTLCWLFRDQLLEKINAGFDEIAFDKEALSAAQREEMEAEINQSALMIERNECSLIWAADAKGEIVDFRSTTSPQAVLGVRLRNVPRATNGHSTSPFAYDLVQPGGRR
jgi:hypothetical protein